MTEPSPELVEEIADILTEWRFEHANAQARAVLSSPSIARALEKTTSANFAHVVTPQVTGLSAIAQERDELLELAHDLETDWFENWDSVARKLRELASRIPIERSETNE